MEVEDGARCTMPADASRIGPEVTISTIGDRGWDLTVACDALDPVLDRALEARLAEEATEGESPLATLLGLLLELLPSREEAGREVARDDDVVCLERGDLPYRSSSASVITSSSSIRDPRSL